ncbi:MAG: FAD-dependent oxidoreductase [Actinobacteria bacterium]|nr:MAG: FAD-dependent oxidoreductase [Actinomycetota bacterium]
MKKKSQKSSKAVYPPCQANCPVNTDVRGYVAAIGRGDYAEAYRLITEKNYFPSVCGRVCPHPCQDDCRRACIDKGISVAGLKRFVSDYVNQNKLFLGKPSKKSGKKVAVIGAGPAGLTAAADLAKAGHKVTIYEKSKKAGGMLAYGVPNFRLTQNTLDEDISRIIKLGVQLKTGVDIGKTTKFGDLVKKYDAVLISVGLALSRSIPIPGVDNADVLMAIPFLKAANTGKPLKTGKRVVVVGGGDVAMDVARVAKRTGGKEVTVLCLESDKEMPAHIWEIEEAKEEGIKIYPAFGPKAIQVKAGKITAMDFVKCTSVFDKNGAFAPKFNEKVKKRVPADTVIMAIGQGSDLSLLDGSNVKLNERGQLITNPKTLQTSNPKVFGAGEVAKGPGAAINAIAHAHQVAESVDNYLRSKKAGFSVSEYEKLGGLPDRLKTFIDPQEVAKPSMRPAKERVRDYKVFEGTLKEKEAISEAHRCLSCMDGAVVDADKCAACITCVRVCPYEVPVFKDNVAYIDPQECQACGFCAADCPAEAIKMNVLSATELNERIQQAVKGKNILALSCEYSFNGLKPKLDKKTAQVTVPCVGRVSYTNLMKAFEAGFKKVNIVCLDNECRHKDGLEYIKRRAAYVNERLKELGFDDDSVVVEE